MFLGGILFILGLCVGSFINSFLWRYQEKKTFKGRSMCPFCAHKIAWYDNIPLISWFMLSGRCRNCKKSISIQYPIVELLTGIIFTIIGIFSAQGVILREWISNIFTFSSPIISTSTSVISTTPPVILNRVKDLEFVRLDSSVSPQNDAFLLVIIFIIASIMIMISVYDYKTKEIPNGFNLTFIVLSATYLVVSSIGNQYNIHNIIYNILAGLLAFLFFYSFVYFSKETWMGGGDAKFALGMGLLLGPAGTFLAILIGSVSGSVYGLSIIIISRFFPHKPSLSFQITTSPSQTITSSSRTTPLSSRAKSRDLSLKKGFFDRLKITSFSSEIPFGPFLALGTFISLILGDNIIDWYVKILLGN